jgi:hypothetical protein
MRAQGNQINQAHPHTVLPLEVATTGVAFYVGEADGNSDKNPDDPQNPLRKTG